MALGTTAGPLNETGALTAAGCGAAGLSVNDEEVGSGGGRAEAGGSGDAAGGVGEEEALSAKMEAKGGKPRRERCSST